MILTLAAALSGAVSIVAFQTGPWMVAAISKALTTILIITYAAWREGGDGYSRAILAGLVASLTGDVFLLWPQQGFLPGLAAFLLAHLAYLHAFTGGLKRGLALAPSIGYAVYTVVAFGFLWSSVPTHLRAPVIVYVAALMTMAAAAAARATQAKPEKALPARTAALGAALFVLSDTILAFDKFMGPIAFAHVFILAAYWLAQWAIASSVRPER
ncbi:MAG TPA: lysoplasmalogenase [Beijerinckiaceae bacterium]|nr:lysoplasmalogenase [Beijerinckiaceae bacterium]